MLETLYKGSLDRKIPKKDLYHYSFVGKGQAFLKRLAKKDRRLSEQKC